MPSNGASQPKLFEPELVKVLLPLPLGRAYSYGVPEGLGLQPGDFVRVPLGGRDVTGVVWDGDPDSVPPEKLKSVIAKLPVPPLTEVARQFIDWVARYNIASAGAVLKMTMSVPAALDAPKPITAYAAIQDPPDYKSTKSRERVLEVLRDGPPRIAAELARDAAVGTSVIKILAKAGAIATVELPPPPKFAPPDPDAPGPLLSEDQAVIATALRDHVTAGEYVVDLLEGVPGAGKTEVYLEAVAEALRLGHQALVLLPEIALSAQWLDRFKARFGLLPALWHSDLTGSVRRDTWRAVASGEARVIIGARSALFLPYRDLGVIVVDEEHDASFKQEEGVIYNARDMSVVRANLGKIPVILVSATPSLESATNAERGRYHYHVLPDRHAGAAMPDIDIVDLRVDKPARGTWLSPSLISALTETFEAGEQAMLFLNRRGYAPLTLCRTCGHRLHCPQCSTWLVEHRLLGRLQCHHCGYGMSLPKHCPSCEKEDTLAACGPGVERLAEEIDTLFPDIRYVVAASDTIWSPGQAASLVRDIEDRAVDLIIGTQIVAKGYHFPYLTLVGVVDADLGLSGGDLRATERTFQLLYQVAGRAGRADRPGRVLLQTFMAEHPVMQALASGDRKTFLAAESQDREEAGMPPFGRLVGVIVSGLDENEVAAAARALGRTAPRDGDIRVLGPAPAPLNLLRGRHRQRLLLKAPRDVNVQAHVRNWIRATQLPRKVRVQLDVDPYSFL
ncbi:MAG: primosomal protein N' [Proteobacteria bacterium]|nr:primosomal protein N' [Pseudomonadota bacterium]